MFNEYYSSWYSANLKEIPYHLQKMHEDYPTKPLVISEWGLCEPRFKGGDKRRCEEMVQQLAVYGAAKHVAGAIYFCLNDYRTFIGEDSTYAYPQRVHGICDIKLNPKPSYDTLKRISAPLQLISNTPANGKRRLVLKGSEGIPAYTIKGYYTTGNSNKKNDLPEVKPGQRIEVILDEKEQTIHIYRPTGYSVLKKVFK